MQDRQTRLLRLIEEASGKKIREDTESGGGVGTDAEMDDETMKSELTMEPAE